MLGCSCWECLLLMLIHFFIFFIFFLFFILFYCLVVFLIHLLSSFLMSCGICTNRKWNYRHVSVLPFIFVSCSLTIEKVGRHSFPVKYLFYFILFNLIYFIFLLPFQKVLLTNKQTDGGFYRVAPQLKMTCDKCNMTNAMRQTQ